MIDPQFKKYPLSYILQAFLGGLLIAISIYLFDFLLNTFHVAPDSGSNEHIRTYIVGSIAASTFLVFGAPHLGSSKPKKIFLGHFISALTGIIICFILSKISLPSNDSAGMYLGGFVSIFSAVLLMTVFDIEHPPAAGTALALATHNEQWKYLADTNIPSIFVIAIFILFIAAILSFIRYYFYFDNDHLKSIEGLGSKVQAVLYNERVTTVSGLYNRREEIKTAFEDILLKDQLYRCYCEKNEVPALIQRWFVQAELITSKKKWHHFLKDLF